MINISKLSGVGVCLLCLVACQTQKENKQIENVPIVIPVKTISSDSIVKASTYFKNATVIPLETSDSCLLTSLKKVIPYKNKLYVLDHRNQTGVFCFDMNGNLLKIIGNKGAGPQEHTSLDDFSVEEESGLIYLNNRDRQRILVFTEKGEYVKSIPTERYFDKIEIFEDHLYLAKNNDRADTYDLEIKDKSGKTLGRYFPSPIGKYLPIPQLIKTNKGIYYYPNRAQDSIYSIFNSEFRLFFYVDFGEYAIKRSEWEKITDAVYESSHPFWQTLLQNNYIGGFSPTFIFDKLIVFGFTYQMNGGWKSFYEMNTGKTSTVLSFVDDLSYVGFNQMVSQTDCQMICALEQPNLERTIESIRTFWVDHNYVTAEEAEKGSARLEILQNQLTEESNPVVIIYDLK